MSRDGTAGGRAERATPLEGRLKTWDDARGFGFIEPVGGGPDVFVHISAFGPRRDRPQAGERLVFRVEAGDRGRPRACDVRALGARGVAGASRRAGDRGDAGRRPSRARAPINPAPLFVIPAAAIFYLLVTAFWPAPPWLPWLYGAASVITFGVYAMDKAAARRGGRRTPESTLHLLSLSGGWPGALLAQAILRHKSVKMPFRLVFWCTVLANCLAAVFLCSPVGRSVWGG